MFNPPQPKSKLEVAFDKAVDDLNYHDVTSDKYNVIMDRVVKLHKLMEDEKPSRVSRDTLALIAANLTGIILIIRHENVNVIASKAMSFVVKPR